MRSDAQEEAMKEAFRELDHVLDVGEEFEAGLMGYQIDLYLFGVDSYTFNLYVEDVGIGCEWGIVQLASGRFMSDVPDDCELVATAEVKRFPEVNDDDS